MSADETFAKLTKEAIEKLDLAQSELFKLPQNDKFEIYDIGTLGRSIGLIREFQKPIFERRPVLRPPPPEDNIPDPPLTKEQTALVNELNETDKKKIDDILLSYTCQYWRKMEFIVGKTMIEIVDNLHGIPDVYYAQRVRHLVEEGTLESQGNLACMRYSEVSPSLRAQ